MYRSRTLLAAATMTSAAFAWYLVLPLYAQDKPAGTQDKTTTTQEAKASVADTSLSGPWHFNPDLSTDVSQLALMGDFSVAPPNGRPAGSSGGYGGRGGGGFGGRGGGFGGRPNGGTNGGYASGVSTQDQVQIDALRRDVMRYTDRLDIVEHESDLVLTFSDGVVRKFPLSGKDEEIPIGAVNVKSNAARDGTSIVQELVAGPLKIKRTFQTALNGELLIVSVKAEPGSSGGPRPGGQMPAFKLIYQRPADWTGK